MRDPYTVLGLHRGASADQIKKAFRALAKKYHPDATKNDPAADKTFKEVTAAYDLLTDPEKKRAYDRGEIDAAGQPRAYDFARSPGGRPRARPGGADFNFDFAGGEGRAFKAEDFFADLFGFSNGKNPSKRGEDVAVKTRVGFADAARGGTARVTLPSGRTIEVKIPAGVESGQVIRLRGQGETGAHGGEHGDALVEVTVAADPVFRREGRDIHCDLAITLSEAIEGAKIEAPTIDGPVKLSVPAGSNTGTKLRLKGKGIGGDTPGDQYVTLRVTLPDTVDGDLRKAILKAEAARPYNPRAPRKG